MSYLRLVTVGLFLILFFQCQLTFEPSPYANIIKINPNESQESILKKASYVIPSPRQLKWQQRELTAFIHFGMNTFTDKEWGDGAENPDWFNPKNFDANQWVTVLKEAGFKLIIITAKHHDGFCLWPSLFTKHSVQYSRWKNGEGDIIKELADACVRQKMDLGIYLSPWDRHEPTYGTDNYNVFFKGQLRELLTNYGDISEVWFDGAVGEGPNGKKQSYDWQGYYDLIRALQPQATIAVKGPDIRWVGTESGNGRETEWSTVPVLDTFEINEENKIDNTILPELNASDEEIGTLNKLILAKSIKWYPSEVDVSLRPGWFYHVSEDNDVKSPEKLLDIYFNSVGKNSTLLLNIAPDKNGKIPEKDATILKVFQNSLRQIFVNNLATEANITSSEFKIQHRASSVLDEKFKTYWSPDNSIAPYLIFEWDEPIWFNILALGEQIEYGQRVSSFQLEIFENDAWVTKLSGTTIGYKRLLRFPFIQTKKVRLIFAENRNNPYISTVGFYQDLPRVTISPSSQTFSDTLLVSMSTNDPNASIFYTQNFNTPTIESYKYRAPFLLKNSTPILALAVDDKTRQESFISNEIFSKAKYKVDLLTTPDPEYLHDGGIVLCDGIKGESNFKSNKWLGYADEHLEVIFDLKKSKDIRQVNVIALINKSANIVAPEQIKLFSSQDGSLKGFTLIHQSKPIVDSTKVIQNFVMNKIRQSGQYLKVLIENPGKNVKDSAQAKWIFISEIEVE